MNLAYLEQEHRITAAEADVASLLRPGTIFTLMQEIAGEHSVALGCGRMELLEKFNIVWMLSRVSLKMERYPALFDSIRIRTWPGVTSRASYPRYFEFYDDAGQRLGAASSTWVLADLDTRRLVLPRAAEFSFEADPSLVPPLPEPGRLHLDMEGAVRFERTPRYEDIDENGHMNNARYVDWITDLFPINRHKNGRIAELCIHYAAELMPEQPVEVFLKENGAEFAVTGGPKGHMAFEAAGRWTDAG